MASQHVVAAPLALVVASLPIVGCRDGGAPTKPTTSTVVISAVSPPSGSTIAPIGTPPGAFLPRLSGMFGVTIAVTAGEMLPFAQLNVYLMTSDGVNYCGQNLPDSPTWRSFPGGQTITYTVTGFQVYRLPCEVTSVRAIFHTRDDPHVGGIPPVSFIVADTTMAAVYQLRQ